MAKSKSHRPDNTHTLTPHLVVAGCAKAMEFYQQAFGAVEVGRMAEPNGIVMHAEMRIGDSVFYLNDEFPEMGAKGPKAYGGTSMTLHLYVPDCDATFQQAVAAGATVKRPLQDMFWGDRYGQVEDPFGYTWAIATQKEELTAEEVMDRVRQSMVK